MIFFFVFTGAIALVVVAGGELRDAGWLVLLPVWLLGSTVFWLWVPRFLLHRTIALRALLPGALLATVVLGGATATTPFFLPATLNANGKAFGSFGVVITMIGWLFIMITMSLVCAVFSPVWASWRQSERQRQDAAAAAQKLLLSGWVSSAHQGHAGRFLLLCSPCRCVFRHLGPRTAGPAPSALGRPPTSAQVHVATACTATKRARQTRARPQGLRRGAHPRDKLEAASSTDSPRCTATAPSRTQ